LSIPITTCHTTGFDPDFFDVSQDPESAQPISAQGLYQEAISASHACQLRLSISPSVHELTISEQFSS
jgi:hypothetical protein